MKGYRAKFFKENAILESIEILTWAVRQPCFMTIEVKETFGVHRDSYKDFDHEIDERVRKLLKSGMILVADEGLLKTQEAILKSQEIARLSGAAVQKQEVLGELTFEKIASIREALAKLKSEKRGKGRPPRIYFVTSAAAKYVDSRSIDFIEKAQALEVSVPQDKMLDYLYQTADRMMKEDMFEDLNRALYWVPPADLSTDILLGVLAATLAGKVKLPSRAEFFKEALEISKARGEAADDLFQGLE